MKRKILLYLFVFNLILSVNALAFNVNVKGGLAYKQDVTEEVSTATANTVLTESDTPTKLALDAEISFVTGANIEVGAGIKYSFLTVSQQAAVTAALTNDIIMTDLTGYGMFKVNYEAYNADGEAMSLSPYLQLNVGLPVSVSDGGDGGYTLVGKSFYEIGFGVEMMDTMFEVSYARQKYELDEQTELTYLDIETINLKIGVKFKLFEGGGSSSEGATVQRTSYY